MLRFLTTAAEEASRKDLFLRDGTPVDTVEVDGDAVIYRHNHEEHVGTLGVHVVWIGQLGFEGTLRALRYYAGDRYTCPGVGLVLNKHCFVICEGRLCVRFLKRRGRVPHYAAVTLDEAEAIRDGRGRLVYYKGTNHYKVKVNDA